jgi:integrase
MKRNKLTDVMVKKLKPGARGKPQFYGDGSNLYLQVSGNEKEPARSWVLRYTRADQERYMGLGAYPTVTLGMAREKTLDFRRVLDAGRDPFDERRGREIAAALEVGRAISFQKCAEQFVEAKKITWKSEKHAADWPKSLEFYAYPVFKDLPVGLIEVSHVLKILSPVWTKKTETATRLRGRIEQVLNWAKVQGFRQGENPARWKENLDKVLADPALFQKVEHFNALPYAEVGAFMSDLRDRDGVAARALEFTILTCARTSEIRGGTWDEVSITDKMWAIPPERMKNKQPHRIPLSKPAIAVLEEIKKLGAKGYIFPGGKPGEMLSTNAMLALLERMGHGDITVHGFRSAFSDWAEDTTPYPPAVIDRVLSHNKKEATQKAYFRFDLFERRVSLMEDWANYCGTMKQPAEVVPIRRAE